MQVPLVKNHPIENIVAFKCKSLADLMPFLKLGWRLEKRTRK